MKSKKEGGLVSKIPVSDWEIFGVRVFGGGEREVLKKVEDWLLAGEKRKWIATVNPEFVMRAGQNKKFMEILAKTDLNVADGVGLIWAKGVRVSKSESLKVLKNMFRGMKVGVEILLGKHKEGLVPGADLMKSLCLLGNGLKPFRTKRVFFLGGWEDRAARTARNLKFQISNLKCAWSEGEPEIGNEEVIKQINEFKPDILFVAYGMQKQEEWIYRNLEKIDVGVVMGVGRSFDYYSGDLKRAPDWIRKMGMEWLYSLIIEPKRWRRQLALPKFIWKVLCES